MGSPKIQTVGGGSATGTADAFNKFLQNGLSTGNFGGPNGASTGVAQANGQTQNFGSAINSMLSGQPGGPNNFGSFFDSLRNNGNGGATYNSDIGGTVFGANPSGSSVAGTGDLLNYDTNSPEFAALKHLQDMRTQQGLADIHARYGAGGGNALGSGASLADSQFLSNANATNTLALGDLGRQMQQMDMNNRMQNGQLTAQHIGQLLQGFGMDANNALQNQGMKNQFALGSAQAGQNMFNAQSDNTARMLQMLFSSLNGSNQLGTPQAQSVQSPSAFGQFINGVGSIVGDIGQLASFKNPFGGGGNTPPFGGGMPPTNGPAGIPVSTGTPQYFG